MSFMSEEVDSRVQRFCEYYSLNLTPEQIEGLESLLQKSPKCVEEALDYCAPYYQSMWAARVAGALLNKDFRDAAEDLKARLENK